MSRIKQPDIGVEVLPGLTIPEELLKVYSGGFKLDLNARVDKVGKDHMNGHIYRVIIGDQQPLYLSDARLDFGNPVVAEVLSTHNHVHSGVLHSGKVTTAGEEPEIRGNLSGGLSREWIDWFRVQGKGYSLMEARDEGLRRLGKRTCDLADEEPEPNVAVAPGCDVSQQWITWYRRRYGVSLSDALAEGRRRLSQLPGN